MTQVIIDTDILSYYFKGDEKIAQRFGEHLQEFDQINISIITYYEIVAGLKFKQAEKQLRDFEEFVDNNKSLTYPKVQQEYREISTLI